MQVEHPQNHKPFTELQSPFEWKATAFGAISDC